MSVIALYVASVLGRVGVAKGIRVLRASLDVSVNVIKNRFLIFVDGRSNSS